VSLADEELVQRHVTGDKRAFAGLVERYAGSVFNLAYQLTHDEAEAEDITQDTFLRVYRALPRSDWQRPFKPWLFTIATNLCRDWARRRAVSFSALTEETDELSDEEPSLIEHLEEKELHKALQHAVDSLPPAYRVVIVLRYTEGLSYEQISEALDLPLNTVRTHLSRAKQRLRAALVAELGDVP
jgi:RNA polymerase sigma-70 factor, ECF subfamily